MDFDGLKTVTLHVVLRENFLNYTLCFFYIFRKKIRYLLKDIAGDMIQLNLLYKTAIRTGVSRWRVVGALTLPQCLKVLFFLLDGLWTVLKISRNILQDFQKFLIILYNVEKNFKKTSKMF
jgi:hypothetical protein